MSKQEQFSNRWGIILASLGMAIGAGNLWRFPRLAGQYGGSFILLWILFLFIWSIPILLAEFSIGKKYKKGVIGSYANLAGKPFTFLGFFITLCTLGIAFYYTVVTGWALRYLGFSVSNLLHEQPLKERLAENPELLNQFWDKISNQDPIMVVLYIVVSIIGVVILSRGIQKGLEKANKILIPSLFVILLLIVFISLSLENGILGLEYMFSIQAEDFKDPVIWIEALTQSAWSTGAGWGLLMTLSSYSRNKEDVTLNTFIGAFGNNTASLIAGMAILPAVFALSASEAEALTFLKSGSQALTFTIIPKLFSTVPGGAIIATIFFLALFLAAFSSLLSMVALLMSNLKDAGMNKGTATGLALILFVLIGFPSVWSLDFFTNQDWVWGVGLLLSGLFIIIGSIKHGLKDMKTNMIDADSDFKASNKYFTYCMIFNVPLAIFLIYWWMAQGYSQYPWFDANGNWNVFDVYSNASIVTQWVGVLVIGFVINKFLYKKFA